MTRIPSTPPVIRPLEPANERPLWSVMIPVYNCAKFLPETLNSVLSQEIPEQKMQIEVVDDSSTDYDVEGLVNEIGKGRVKYFRQQENVGSLLNFETCINRSVGKLVHLLHGDDKVIEGYYDKLEGIFNEYPEAGAAFARYRSIDEHGSIISEREPEMYHDGILPDWLTTISERQRIQYAAITVRREVYEAIGSFYGVNYGEDWEMWVRIARNYPVAYTPELLAEYRKHYSSISGSKFLTGAHLQDLLHTMQLIQKHIPDKDKKEILLKSRKYYASYGIKVANELWDRYHDRKIVNAQLKHILNLSKHPTLYWRMAKLYYKSTLNK
jgi:glycosyltransferase involved in cell wall biosynthesis